ncbi:MAG: right-handed parallel beta-helix repeat-containing protein [Phycisphaeraceae bacterium]|nr:MAG: right-handed parallel beta-helix repeat-containing protein [Phycisphaeraceae bacterium]
MGNRGDRGGCLCLGVGYRGLGLAVVLVAAGASASFGEVLFVDQAATGAGDGSSWTDAFTDLQEALAEARGEPGRYDAIWVAGGVYTPASADGDRDISFELVDGVALLGGFRGDEADSAERTPMDDDTAPETALSGDLNGDDGPGGDNRGENARSVVTTPYGIGRVILDRLIVERGEDDLVLGPTAGVTTVAADCTFTDCVIRQNRSAGTCAGLLVGGVLTERVEILRCVFEGNASQRGGAGLFIAYHSAEVTVTDSRFEGNEVASTVLQARGGAIFIRRAPSTFTRCNFIGNAVHMTTSDAAYAETEGGAIYCGDSNDGRENPLIVRDCRFESNTSLLHDSPVGYAGGGAIFSENPTTVVDSTFVGNTSTALNVEDADQSAGGGAVVVAFSSEAVLRESLFESNRCESSGIASGGAVHLGVDQSAVIDGCVFSENSSMTAAPEAQPRSCTTCGGGAVSIFSSGTVDVLNSTFDGNSFADDSVGLFSYSSFSPGHSGGALLVFASGAVHVAECGFLNNETALYATTPHDFDYEQGPFPSGASLSGETVDVRSCGLDGNTLTVDQDRHNRPAEESAALAMFSDSSTITNTLITRNLAPMTGGLYIGEGPTGGEAIVTNATIASNVGQTESAAGLYTLVPTRAVNTIAWDNASTAASLQDQQIGAGTDVILGGSFLVDSSIVAGWDDSLAGSNTLDADPLFVDPELGDYHLSPGSPAIDSGDNTALPADLDADLDGFPRRIDDPMAPDTGIGEPPIVDRGAYEAVGSCPADFAPPYGLLDLSDVTAFVFSFLNPDYDDRAQMLAEPYDVADLADVVAFVTSFSAGCP